VVTRSRPIPRFRGLTRIASMHRYFAALLLTFLMPLSAFAQSAPDASSLIARLRSGSSSEVAWAAFEAGTYQVQEAIPALVAALDSPPPGSDQERYYVASGILDALIQMRGVPGATRAAVAAPTTIAPYYDKWPIQTLILLGRAGPERNPILLNRFRTASHQEWFAIANLLLPSAPVGFASTLLKELRFTLTINVVDPNSDSSGIGVGGGALMAGDGFGQKPLGFPPHAIYKFAFAGPEAVVLSSGPRIVYYTRHLTTQFQFPVSSATWGSPDNEDRLTYLGAIFGPFNRFALHSRSATSIEWRNERIFRSEAARQCEGIALVYRSILDGLIVEGHLTAEERQMLPFRLDATVIDKRSGRSQPLPNVTSGPPCGH